MRILGDIWVVFLGFYLNIKDLEDQTTGTRGTFRCSPVPKTGTRAHWPKPSSYDPERRKPPN